jgi:predicted alpha/beta-hydrolase family hydrolase
LADNLSANEQSERERSMRFLIDGSEDALVTIMLAHGAGAPMDSTAMDAITGALSGVGFRIVRFEFDYMAARRSGGRKPPPKAELLKANYGLAVAELNCRNPLVIGGKSMGGRVASMVADELYDKGEVAGLLCFGYPFHPPSKPHELRTGHLEELRTPALICQGTRDHFGTRGEVEGYRLADQIEILWLEDGDHDLKPRKKLSGFSPEDHLATLARTAQDWTQRRIGP